MKTLQIAPQPNADTNFIVCSVLEFMSTAFSSIHSANDDMPPDAMLGAAQIMDACANALKEAKATRGGNGR